MKNYKFKNRYLGKDIYLSEPQLRDMRPMVHNYIREKFTLEYVEELAERTNK